MNKPQSNFWTVTFKVDPDLNGGYTEVFKQGDEPWWWYTKGEYGGPAAGPNPDFTGAVFKSLHHWDKLILET